LKVPLKDFYIKPILKWAGGKRWFVSKYNHLFPSMFNVYYEPFLGSAAVFFQIRPKSAVLSDSNCELINTYAALRDDWKSVWLKLKVHQRNHCNDYYYRIRMSRPRTDSSKAARFIYLNRTCFNGIYRVNKRGVFNVPKGTKDTVIFPDDNFENVSILLKNTQLISCDFEEIISRARKGDFLYIDPPYTVKHNNNNFVKYNERIFSWSDQERLAKSLSKASARGVKFLLSNANNLCVAQLYRKNKWIYFKVERHSVLASEASKRKKTSELVVMNYKI